MSALKIRESPSIIEVGEFMQEYRRRNKKSPQIEDIHYATVDEYAERTKRAPGTVRAMCNRGEIEGAIKDGKFWRIPIKDSPDTTRLKEENLRLSRENAALRERLGCVKALLEI